MTFHVTNCLLIPRFAMVESDNTVGKREIGSRVPRFVLASGGAYQASLSQPQHVAGQQPEAIQVVSLGFSVRHLQLILSLMQAIISLSPTQIFDQHDVTELTISCRRNLDPLWNQVAHIVRLGVLFANGAVPFLVAQSSSYLFPFFAISLGALSPLRISRTLTLRGWDLQMDCSG